MPNPHSTKRPTTTDTLTIGQLLQRPVDQLRKEYGRLPLDYEINNLIDKVLHEAYHPHLKGTLSYYEPIRGDTKHVVDGDFICYSILYVCEILRSKDPIYREISSQQIAMGILHSFPKSQMVHKLKLVDAGFFSFKLNGEWMAQRIRKNLMDGIVSWAPIFSAKRVLVDFPEQDIETERHGDLVRATYIRDLVASMLEYSGVEVCSKIHNRESMKIVKKEFPQEKGVIKNRRTRDSLFDRIIAGRSNSQTNNVHEDLAALWCGGNVQKANWIIYVTHVRQREYVLKCFDAAKAFVKEDQASLRYLGYQSSSNGKEKLSLLWQHGLFFPTTADAASLGKQFGHTSYASIMECIIRYNYLKKYTYSDCTFEDDEIFDDKGNNFPSLLETRDKIRSVVKRFPHLLDLESKEALVGEDREFGLQLLRFTDVIRVAVIKFRPHMLCDYLYDLSKCSSELVQRKPSKTQVLLCKAADVVLEKVFDILGITPKSPNAFSSVQALRHSRLLPTRDQYMALPVLSPKLSSRFEIPSMSVSVDFEEANLFGYINVCDWYGLHPDKWSGTDVNGCGQVTHFNRDWYNSVVIPNTCLFPIPFGDPASCVSLPLSQSIKVVVRLWVSFKEKKEVYQVCNVEGDKGKIKLENFWKGKQNMERSTFLIDAVNGSVRIYYYLIKEAVDTSLSLTYRPSASRPKVRGWIRAYYGDGALDSCPSYEKNFYKALIFETGPTNELEGDIKLNRSMLAVPKNVALVFECFFENIDSGNTIMKGTSDAYREGGADNTWTIEGENCRFILTVNWIPVRHSI